MKAALTVWFDMTAGIGHAHHWCWTMLSDQTFYGAGVVTCFFCVAGHA